MYHRGNNLAIMRLPYRKPGKYMTQKPDYTVTQAKLAELEKKLQKLLSARPQAVSEVSRLAELGDFSENVEYQLAKGRLRGLNNKILEIEHILKNAEVITPSKNKTTVQVGHTVTVKIMDKPFNSTQGKLKTFQILGSAETDPNKNIISQNSPLGSALIGKKVGETIEIKLPDKNIKYKILGIK